MALNLTGVAQRMASSPAFGKCCGGSGSAVKNQPGGPAIEDGALKTRVNLTQNNASAANRRLNVSG